MSLDDQLAELLERWEASGRTLAPERLCADCTHLIEPLREAISQILRADAALDPRTEPEETRDDEHAATEPAAHVTPMPTQIGPYHILGLLGSGGMGEVYKAEQRSPIRRVVAIKVIKFGYQDFKAVIARFEGERQALARMDHPNVARVLDAGATDTGRPYFVMDFVPGKPITQFCDDNKLSIKERLSLFTQACDAITHAHTKAIIHRDIKSSNVLAYMHDGKPTVKVIDFGIAKALSGDRLSSMTMLTDFGRPIGTPEYMSPEQADDSADIDTRTDVYSLGVLLYELLTGALPFDSRMFHKAAVERVREIIRDVEPPRPSTKLSSLGAAAATRIAALRDIRIEVLTKHLRRELEWIPLKAMRKERQRRYASPAQLAEDIRNYLDGKPLIAGPESRLYRLRKLAIRRRTPIATALAITAVLATGSAFYVRNITRAERAAQLEAKRSEAVQQFLTEMLANANPRTEPGHEVTVKNVLDVAAKTVQGRFKDEPVIEATVRGVIGEQYFYLERPRDAEPHFRRAYELFRDELGTGHTNTLAMLNNLTLTLPVDERVALLDPLLKDALAKLGEDHEGSIMIKSNLGMALKERGEGDQARSMLRDVLERRRRLLGNDDRRTTEAMNNLSMLLPFEQGVEMLREAVERANKNFKPDDPDTLRYKTMLAVNLMYRKQHYAEAETLLKEAVDGYRRVYQGVATYPVSQLASLHLLQSRWAEAEPLWRECYDWDIKNLPEHHVDTAIALRGLGLSTENQGKLRDAESHYRELFDWAGRACGKLHEAAGWQQWYGKFLVQHDRFEQAEQPLLECWENVKRYGAPKGTDRDIAKSLVTVYDRTNRPALAERWRDELRRLSPSTSQSVQPATTRTAAIGT